MNRIRLMNIEIDNVTIKEAIEATEILINKGENSFIVTPNVDHIVKVQEDIEFKEIYDKADLVLADGMPLIWVSKLLRKSLKEKVSGSDLFPLLCKMCEGKGYSVFLLGSASQEIIETTAQNLNNLFPKLKIVGKLSPSFGFEKKENETKDIIEKIKSVKPDILFVGVGAPKQEKWIYKYKNDYMVPVSIGIGASFDFIAGTVKRAPKWMQNLGLEWFYRFLQEPKRMFRRYFIDDSKFFKLILKEVLNK